MSQPAVYIRKYAGEAEFQADAGQYVGRGYRIASQSWEQGGPSAAGKLFFVLAALMAAPGLVYLILGQEMAIVLLAFALVVLAIAGRERVKVLSVTYEVSGSDLAPASRT